MVRKALDLFASTATDSGWRVCILDSADDLNANAANALLKVLEEPPPRALFLILAHQPGRLLPTIRSRCGRSSFGRSPRRRWRGRARPAPPFVQPDERSLTRAAVSRRARSAGRSAWPIPSPPASWRRGRDPALPGRCPDWGRVLKLAETLNGRDGEERFAARRCGDALRLRRARRRQGEPVARLAALVEVCERFARSAREAATYNLDRRPVVLSLFADLAQSSAQSAARAG